MISSVTWARFVPCEHILGICLKVTSSDLIIKIWRDLRISYPSSYVIICNYSTVLRKITSECVFVRPAIRHNACVCFVALNTNNNRWTWHWERRLVIVTRCSISSAPYWIAAVKKGWLTLSSVFATVCRSVVYLFRTIVRKSAGGYIT